MYGWNDFSFKNVLGAAYNQVRFYSPEFTVNVLNWIFEDTHKVKIFITNPILGPEIPVHL